MKVLIIIIILSYALKSKWHKKTTGKYRIWS